MEGAPCYRRSVDPNPDPWQDWHLLFSSKCEVTDTASGPHRQCRQPERCQIKLPALGQPLDALERPVVDVLRILGDLVVLGQGLAEERLEAMHFGVADYAASCRARTTVIGGLNPDYPGDQWHAGLSQMLVACRAFGLRAIDGPFGDFNDPESYVDAAKRGAALGFEGKWAIHPSQIELANKVYTPPESEVTHAKQILIALDEAAKEGRGAAQLNGRMIDAASAKMAENIVNTDKAINGKVGV